jgi:DNA-binding transcriptional ArsR family regulator
MTTTGWIQNDEEDAWIWRGKVRSRWESVGFDSGIFELFMNMKGAKTRLSLLDALCVPKDRMQLAQELGLDWKAIDYHVVRLSRHGLVHEDHAFGKVKLYRLTASGEALLRLVGEFNGEVYKDARVARLDASAAHD